MRDSGPRYSQAKDVPLGERQPLPMPESFHDMSADRPFPSARGVLTKEEIEALLRPNLPDDIGVPDQPGLIEARPAPRFVESKDPPEVLAQRRQAGELAAKLSLALGRSTGVKAAIALREVQKVDSQRLHALMQGKSGAIACFGIGDVETQVLVCLPDAFADALIAHACGARGSTGRIGDNWTLSAIDSALLHQLLGPLAGAFGEGLTLQAIETDIPYVSSLLAMGELVVAEYAVESPGLNSEMAVISRARAGQQPVVQQASTQTGAGIKGVSAVVTARIASLSVPMSRLTSLKAGSTLLLGLPGDQPVEILSGDRDGPIAFEGQIGRKGNKMAVKITRKLRGVID